MKSTQLLIQRNCLFCDKNFEIALQRLKHGRGKFCSPNCQYAYKKQKFKASKICLFCGSEFIGTKSRIKNREYCSIQCGSKAEKRRLKLSNSLKVSEKAKRQRETIIPKLHKLLKTPEYKKKAAETLLNRLADPAKYKVWKEAIDKRTNSASWRSSPQFKRGAENSLYKGNKSARESAMAQLEYKNWRKAVFERDNYTCQSYKIRNGNGKAVQLNAHHIKLWSLYPDLRYEVDNGLTLCKSCHNKTHSK